MKRNSQSKDLRVSRTHKARLFEMIFSDKKELLELYNAVNQTHYADPEALEINTLENAIYLSMHNDISFVIDSRLSLYEHQSTYSPNLPLRYLMYISDLYSVMTKDDNLYGSRVVKIPSPRFLIFYNGIQQRPEREVLRLSEMFAIEDKEPALELYAELININPGNNRTLMNMCKTLRDYSEYTARVRKYVGEMSTESAVERAINECIQEGILSEFLSKAKSEAIKMSIYEYDEERQRQFDKAEGLEEGLMQGMDRFAALTKVLLDAGKLEELKRATDDSVYRMELLKEYGL